jgi:hypothetical protein
MDDSFVIATELGASAVTAIDSTTGSVSWGFACRDAIKSLKIKEPAFTCNVTTAARRGQTTFGGALV